MEQNKAFWINIDVLKNILLYYFDFYRQLTDIFWVVTNFGLLKTLCRFTLVLVFLYSFCPVCVAQHQDDFSRFATWAKEDPIAMFQNITIEHAIGLGTAGLTFATLSTFDESTSRNFQEYYKQSRFLKITNEFGNKMLILPASAALFGSSLFTNNTKFQDAAFTSLQSVLMTSLTVGASKFMFARQRPYMNEGAYDFDFMSSGQTSFPSGHTARAFSFITPWIMYYPGPLSYSLFALPAGTAIARIAKGKHWLSDVAAGAAIGFSMGYYLSKRHLGTQDIQVTPTFGKDLAALSINFEF